MVTTPLWFKHTDPKKFTWAGVFLLDQLHHNETICSPIYVWQRLYGADLGNSGLKCMYDVAFFEKHIRYH